jgi:predicted dehydrogenase
MAKSMRWGILGPGDIARVFAKGLSFLPDAELVAVGSRSMERAKKFAEEFEVPHPHGSYGELVRDADVDVIYVCTPHPFHKENSLLALNAGKAVLCEKPFTINAKEAEEVISVARGKKLFVMEAMWTRFLPVMGKVREWLSEGVIGEVRMLSAQVGFRSGWNPEARDLKLELGGGALLDMGCYTLSFASMVMGGPPGTVSSTAHIGETSVDEQSMAVLGYEGGVIGFVCSAIRTSVPADAYIYGTEGSIHVHPAFWGATTATLKIGRKDEETVEMPHEGNGYNYEAAEIMRCIREGKTESEIMPLDETLSLMKTMDEIRAQWGLRYPTEGGG